MSITKWNYLSLFIKHKKNQKETKGAHYPYIYNVTQTLPNLYAPFQSFLCPQDQAGMGGVSTAIYISNSGRPDIWELKKSGPN